MTETIETPVALSGRHDGQHIEHSVTLLSEGARVKVDTDAFRRPVTAFRPKRFQAVHTVWDRAETAPPTVTPSPWFTDRQDADRWLESRGLRLA